MSPSRPRKGAVPLLGSLDSSRLFFRVFCLCLVGGWWPGSARCCPTVRSGPQLDAVSKAHLAPLVFQGKLLRVDAEWPVVRATFRVQKLYKTNVGMTFVREKTDTVVEFSSGSSPLRRGGPPCRGFPLDATELQVQQRYIIFAGIKRPRTLLGVDRPEPHTKRRALARILCDKCAKAPTAKGGDVMNVRVQNRLRLKCKFSGNPPPEPRIAWFKNGVKIRPNDRIRVRSKKRFSRLAIRRLIRSDSGEYECKANNVLGNLGTSSSVRVFVVIPSDRRPQPTNDSTLWPLQGLPCPMSSYCLNGGTCSLYETVGEYVCECAEGYRGRRCESKGSTLSSPAPVDVPQSPHDLDATTRMLQLYWGK